MVSAKKSWEASTITKELREQVGMDFQNCAEAWMPEPKRHMDVLERVLEIHSHLLLHQSLKRGIA